MIYIGIDVAKDKHDCFITNSEGEVLFNAFTIPNNADGFHDLFQKISSLTNDFSNVKVGLEATGHYNYNLLGFLIDKGLPTFVINPLHTNLFRKSLSLRQTKTDKVDAHTIALMMMSGVNLQSYSDTSYHNEELAPFAFTVEYIRENNAFAFALFANSPPRSKSISIPEHHGYLSIILTISEMNVSCASSVFSLSAVKIEAVP